MKIYITGPAWSGKSTISKKLGERFKIPVIHLDDLLWNADWTENENYGKLQEEAIAKPDWIIEWPSCSIVKSLQDVDKIVILDYPPVGNVFRIAGRYFKTRFFGEKRIGMALPDKWNPSLMLKTCIWRKRQLPRLLGNIRAAGLDDKLLLLRTPESAFDTLVKSVTP